MSTSPVRYEGVHCLFDIERPAPGVRVLRISGWDAGEFGDRPMRELEKDLAGGAPIELYIDARDVRGASVEVSGEWSLWLGRHRARFRAIRMLTGSRFIRITADFARRFAGLDGLMELYTDASAFDAALSRSAASGRAAEAGRADGS